jgi:purine-nucleoside phosphorylase
MTTFVTLKQIDQAVKGVRARTSHKPRVGIILGSGLNDLADSVQNAELSLSDLPTAHLNCPRT